MYLLLSMYLAFNIGKFLGRNSILKPNIHWWLFFLVGGMESERIIKIAAGRQNGFKRYFFYAFKKSEQLLLNA